MPTTNYGLPKWTPQDKPNMTEFNDAFEIIDTELEKFNKAIENINKELTNKANQDAINVLTSKVVGAGLSANAANVPDDDYDNINITGFFRAQNAKTLNTLSGKLGRNPMGELCICIIYDVNTAVNIAITTNGTLGWRNKYYGGTWSDWRVGSVI